MATVSTLPGITSRMIQTGRIQTHALLSGSDDGYPVVFVHGNFSAATYFEELMLAMPAKYRCIAPDLRGYGNTENLVIDGRRGARDWSDDLKALSDQFGDRPAHIVGWSLGASVVMQFLLDYPELIASLTFINPVSPYGFGGTKDLQGTPCYDDYAGSGGGVVNPEFIRRIEAGDRSGEDPNSPRNVISAFYYKPPYRAEREEAFLDAALLEKTGLERYPGDFTPSGNWPNVAPGIWGPINATSPKFFNTAAIAESAIKPPVLWVRGDSDMIVSDTSMFDFGGLGKMGFVPGWPGEDIYPPQPMVSQTRAVLDRYQDNGGSYTETVIKDTAHSPHIEKQQEFLAVFLEHIESAK